LDERDYRIVRRSVPYGKAEGEEDVGLLFMCYQKDIGRQFEFLQVNWGSKKDVPVKGAGPDVIIGPDGSETRYQWPLLWNPRRSEDGKPLERWTENPTENVCLPFKSCITFMGGEYFFAPSLPFLKNIDTIGKNINTTGAP